MGVIDKLRESLFKVRVVPGPTEEQSTVFTSPDKSIPNQIDEAIESGKRVDLTDLLNITTLKGDRNTKYSIFEEMVADGRIGSAVEMYANDAVQYGPEGKLLWIESADPLVTYYGEKLIKDLGISENLWSYAYCLCLYGDVYLELFESNSPTGAKPGLLLEPIRKDTSVRKQVNVAGTKLERYVEKVANPAEIYDLQIKGKTAGFVKSETDELQSQALKNTYVYSGVVSDKVTVLNPTKYVHMCLSPNINRFPEKFRLIREETEKITKEGYIDGSNSEETAHGLTFTVKSGQSILENVYGPYQTLKLKEDAVLLERVTRSSITRIIQVELGDLPESQKRQKLQEIKDQIEQQLQLNKESGTIQSRPGAQPTENIIYTTTKNGKGAITSVNIGGDGDVGNLEDLDKSENKLYGSLLIPKALLGADMEGSGLSNGGSLTEMNTTYARRIKRIQVALCSGIKTLINIFAISDGIGSKIVNNFDVHLTPITTVEDIRRDELLQNKIRNVNDILSLMNNIDAIDETTKLNMIIQWLTSYLSQQEIVDIINERLDEMKKKELRGNDSKESEEDDTEYELSPDDGGSMLDDFEMPDIEPNEDIEMPEVEKPELEIDDEIDIADIEGEDLL